MSRKIQIVTSLLLFALFVFVGYTMSTKDFWGWWPMVLQLSFWGGFVFLIHPKFSKHNRNTHFLFAATLSGVLLSASFPPSPLTPIVFFAFVPLLWLENEISKEQKIQKWMVWKYAFHAFYLWNVITTFWVVNTSFIPGLIANTLNAILMATVFMFYHVVKNYVSKSWAPFVLISFWLAFEFGHMYWDINWPWLTLGNTFAQYPSWIQWYEYTGVFGGGLWILVVNYLIYQLIQQKTEAENWFSFIKQNFRSTKSGIICGVIVLPILISLGILMVQPEDAGEGIEVAVVQPNFEPHFQKFNVSDRIQRERFLHLSDSIVTDQTRYLVYPETSFGTVFLNDLNENKYIVPLQRFVNEHENLNLITGVSSYRVFQPTDSLPSTVRKQEETLYDVQNSALQISSQKNEIDVYFKSILVPGAEFFPFRKVLPFIKPIIDLLGGSLEGHTLQEDRTVFQSTSGNVAPVICYESIYGNHVGGYVRNGADMIFVITNDGWWDNTPGHKQHLLFSGLRAIEHRRWIARSANTGTSAFITPKGEVLDATNYEETTAIRRVIYPRAKMTFYSKNGDFIARIAVMMTLLIGVFSISQAWRKKVKTFRVNK